MSIRRDTIFQAFFDLVSTAYAFKTFSRKFEEWKNVPSEERPALFVLENDEVSSLAVRGSGTMKVLTLEIFVYTWSKHDAVPSKQLNDCLDAIDNALKVGYPGGVVTLGGLVQNCYIDGHTIKVPGDLNGDGLAVIPVKILVPLL